MRTTGLIILMAFAGSGAFGSVMGMLSENPPKSTWHLFAFVASAGCMFLAAFRLADI